jgi:hypothetical protein
VLRERLPRVDPSRESEEDRVTAISYTGIGSRCVLCV